MPSPRERLRALRDKAEARIQCLEQRIEDTDDGFTRSILHSVLEIRREFLDDLNNDLIEDAKEGGA